MSVLCCGEADDSDGLEHAEWCPNYEACQAVLTFEDENRGRWLAGALLGSLVSEGGSDEIRAADLKDRAFVLVSFRIVDKRGGAA